MIRRAAFVLLALLWLLPAPGRAQSADDAFAALASTSFDRSGAASRPSRCRATRAPSGDHRVAGRQTVRARPDKALFIKNDDGSFADARDRRGGADVPASALKPVRVNNAVRGAIDAALGALRLFSPDAADRLPAAEAVFRSHDPAALPR